MPRVGISLLHHQPQSFDRKGSCSCSWRELCAAQPGYPSLPPGQGCYERSPCALPFPQHCASAELGVLSCCAFCWLLLYWHFKQGKQVGSAVPAHWGFTMAAWTLGLICHGCFRGHKQREPLSTQWTERASLGYRESPEGITSWYQS